MNLDTSFLPTMFSIGRETIILQQMIEGIDRALNISQFCSIISKFETKFMTRKKIIFYRFTYFTKSSGKIPTAKPFISTVKAGRKLATQSQMARIQSQIQLYWLQFQVLIYRKHVNTLGGPNY